MEVQFEQRSEMSVKKGAFRILLWKNKTFYIKEYDILDNKKEDFYFPNFRQVL